jgi:hypothetical protein
MEAQRLGAWLRRLRATATFVFIVASCLAVAVLVIAFIPGSPVTHPLPADALSGLDRIGGLMPGVRVDPSGRLAFRIADPSLAQRLLHLATMLPGLLLAGEVARRMARLLRNAQDRDPFTRGTVRDLTTTARITAAGGLLVWVISTAAGWALSATMLDAGAAAGSGGSPLAWFAVALIFAAFAQLISRGVAMREDLDTVI